jgi:DNA modification methylase
MDRARTRTPRTVHLPHAGNLGLWLTNDGGHFRKPRTFNFLGQDRMTNVMHYLIGRDGNKRTGHPTEKPELLTQRIIEVFSNPGDIVLDNFA